jgi:large subunit ribosomal protein L6
VSRIGKQPIPVPAGVDVKIDGSTVTAKGPKGELSRTFSDILTITREGDEILVTRPDDSRTARSLHGLTRTLINNMIVGVSTGFTKKLELQGVGYRAALKGANLELSLGYSHPVIVVPEENISFECPDNTHIIVHGIDNQRVGQVAADIRMKRPPEPYKGKGIRYEGEHVRRKLGKAAK